MTDFERELRDHLQGAPLPPAPASLAAGLDRVTAVPPMRRRTRRGVAILAVAAVIASGAIAVVATGGLQDRPDQTPSPSALANADPSSRPTPAASVDGLFPTDVDGVPVITVSELLTERAAGRLSGGPIALAGYWSDSMTMHTCAVPSGDPGELEIYCRDGEFGITERDEPAMIIARNGEVTFPAGPVLTPFIGSEEHAIRLFLMPVNGQLYPPVPIVAIGHLDDPRAARCRPEARQLCLDRFVIDEIAMFDPATVPSPAPSPSPSPFPFDSPPPAPFALEHCVAVPMGTPPVYSFAGWIAGSELDLSEERGLSDEAVYVAITEEAVPLGNFSEPEGGGRRSRAMGRLVCIGREWQPGAIEYSSVAGTTYRAYEDGSTAPP